jgi:hypothetical protein
MSVIYKMNKPKSTVGAMRIKSVSADETETSTAYVVAKDEEGKIAELRSLPNGTKDEIRVSDGKLIKRVSEPYTTKSTDIVGIADYNNVSVARMPISILENCKSITGGTYTSNGQFNIEGKSPTTSYDNISEIGKWYTNSALQTIMFVVAKGTTLEQAKEQLAGLSVTYQLATPIEIPIQASGSLVSYPSGTVYIEPFVADAGIYADKMEVLYSDLPIKALEKISKVDFDTGLETELDITAAVIAEDKLSFTHPNLTSGDIVFFTYEYDRESTEGETEIEYYDSRYVIKDSATEKFYKWHIAVANGVPSIELVEV